MAAAYGISVEIAWSSAAMFGILAVKAPLKLCVLPIVASPLYVPLTAPPVRAASRPVRRVVVPSVWTWPEALAALTALTSLTSISAVCTRRGTSGMSLSKRPLTFIASPFLAKSPVKFAVIYSLLVLSVVFLAVMFSPAYVMSPVNCVAPRTLAAATSGAKSAASLAGF